MCHNGDTRLAVDIIVVSVTVSAAVYRPQMMCLRQKSIFIVRFVFPKKSVYIFTNFDNPKTDSDRVCYKSECVIAFELVSA